MTNNQKVRFLNSTGTTAVINVSASGLTCIICTCSWQKIISFTPPPHQASIIGDDKLMNCGSYSNRYRLFGLSNGWRKNFWDVGSGLTKVSENGYSINIKPTSGSTSGAKTLRASVIWVDQNNYSCGATYVNDKTITVVPPNPVVTGQTQICPGGLYQYYAKFDGAVEPVPGATYSWSYPSGYYSLNGNNNYSLNLRAPMYNLPGGAVSVVVNNMPCSGTFNDGITIYPYCSGSYTFSINPNPAETELSIEIEPQNNSDDLFKSDSGNSVSMVLLDENGLLVKQKKIQEYKDRVDISELKPNIYYIKIFINNDQIDETKRIVKN